MRSSLEKVKLFRDQGGSQTVEGTKGKPYTVPSGVATSILSYIDS